MLTSDGHLYLIDFGIARHFKPGKTKDTTAFGSPGYASPEQYGKAQTTPRSDIYSLGATLHQMLTGDDPSQKPFQFASPQSSGHFIPSSFSTLVMQMVEMNEIKRPVSMKVVKQKLQQIATQPTGKTSLPTQPTGGAFLTSLQQSFGKGKIIGIVAGIVVVILIGSYLISTVFVSRTPLIPTKNTANSPSNPIITPTVAPTIPPTVAPTSTSIPKPGPSRVLYQADWSNSLNGWTGSSDWKAFNDMLISDGTYADTNGSQLSPTIEPPYQVSETSDYAVEVRIQQVSGQGCFDAAVIRGSVVSDGVQGYRLAIGCYGGASIYAAHGSTLNQLAHVDFNPGNGWHIYRLEAQGTTIRAFIDGLQILEVNDNLYLSGGVVGIKSVSTQIDVSSFKVIAL
jgi:serine/threonine protein kinase